RAINLRSFPINYTLFVTSDCEDAILTDLFELKDRLLFQDQDFINVKYGGVIRSVSKVYNYMISVAEVNQNYSKESSPILIHYVMEKPWNVKFPYKTDYPYFKLMWRLGRKMELVKLYILHRLYRIYQLTLVSKEGRKI
ncbi:glycosyltransferase, partial [Bacteroides acidifaciens]|uniref:glycosyltransferase n=2 Tax=Bacteroidia TaxID=200643 RepID=UPI003335A0BD